MQRALIFTLLSLLGISGSIGLSQITSTPEAVAGDIFTPYEDSKITSKTADLVSEAIILLVDRSKEEKKGDIKAAETPEKYFHLPEDFAARNKEKSRLTLGEALEQHYR